MNITEDYCSFEVAKLLKEKGFDEPCECAYSTEGQYLLSCYKGIADRKIKNDEALDFSYSSTAPTLQMAMKWLRIEHNIHIEPHIVRTKRSYGHMPSYVDLKELKQHFPFDEFDFSNADKYVCITYDKACETALKYCLENLIE